MIIMLNLTINWKRVIDTLHKGVVVIDRGGAIRHVNPAFEVLTGYRSDDLMGKPCAVLQCSGCEPWYGDEEFRCALFSSGQPINPTTCRINSKCGRPLKVVRQASVLRDGKGIPVGAVETMWDAADLKGSHSENGFFQRISLSPFNV